MPKYKKYNVSTSNSTHESSGSKVKCLWCMTLVAHDMRYCLLVEGWTIDFL